MLYMLQWLVPLHLQLKGLHEMLHMVEAFKSFCNYVSHGRRLAKAGIPWLISRQQPPRRSLHDCTGHFGSSSMPCIAFCVVWLSRTLTVGLDSFGVSCPVGNAARWGSLPSATPRRIPFTSGQDLQHIPCGTTCTVAKVVYGLITRGVIGHELISTHLT